MSKYSSNPAVDFYFAQDSKWQQEYLQLRKVVLDCGLTEELKWGCPCYTLEGKNIVLIHGFKEYCALLFMKGALLHNADGLLIQQTKNVQAARQIRFGQLKEIVALSPRLKAYIHEAIAVEKAGLSPQLKATAAFTMVEEFSQKLAELPKLKKAFEALTPGRQRAYLLHFASAKQAKTRAARVEKCMAPILEGKGLNEG